MLQSNVGSLFLSADSHSSALLVRLSKEGSKEDYFQILEKNGKSDLGAYSMEGVAEVDEAGSIIGGKESYTIVQSLAKKLDFLSFSFMN